jgi:hypothetical protein
LISGGRDFTTSVLSCLMIVTMRWTASSTCCAFFPHLLGFVVVGLDEIEIADDDAEEVVEIVGDALRNGADGRGLAGFFEPAGEVDELTVDRDEAKLRLHAGQVSSRSMGLVM